jgi:putative intracellular protease/amidase
MKILMVLTSHDQLGDTGRKTGFWLEEFAAPYYRFIDAGANVTLASPKGGQPPLDPMSDNPETQSEDTVRFRKDHQAQSLLGATRKLRDLDPDEFDAVFYPGGHGPLWDLAEDPVSIEVIEHFYRENKPIGAVCHAPGTLRHAKQPDGRPLVSGKHLTGFSNAEEAAVGLTDVVPFLVEDELKHHGGQYTKAREWEEHVIVDNKLVTGQNPASSSAAAVALLDLLRVTGAHPRPGRSRTSPGLRPG